MLVCIEQRRPVNKPDTLYLAIETHLQWNQWSSTKK